MANIVINQTVLVDVQCPPAAMVVIATIVHVNTGESILDVSPLSTNGALVLTNAKAVDRNAFRQLVLGYGRVVTIAAPVTSGSCSNSVAAPHRDAMNLPSPRLLWVRANIGRWSSLPGRLSPL